ncbi:MAG: tail fiber domain-containing protein [bacterium]|nr:tail fiber domain-containing protein [bacterium]
MRIIYPRRFALFKKTYYVFVFSLFAFSSTVFAAPLYAPGETLDPTCSPTTTDCTVSVSNLGASASAGYFTATSSTATSTFAGGFATETSGLVYDYFTNNVGIGTTIPSYKLDVSGFINTDQYSGYKQAGNTILYASSTSFSTLVGNGAGAALLFDGIQNTAIGYQALNVATSSDNNTAVGVQALRSNTTGFSNTATGRGALTLNTTGTDNTAHGDQSLSLNTTGSYNTANGSGALVFATTGSNNTAIGYGTLSALTNTGSNNTANGSQSLASNTTGSNNTAFGYQSLYSNTTVSNQTAVGYQSLYSNTTGSENTTNGYQSLFSNTTGASSTSMGYQSLFSNTTGYRNTANGFKALYANTTGYQNTANGNESLRSNTTGFSNSATGYQAGYSNTTGFFNLGNGYQSLYSNTSGDGNVAIGYQTLYTATSTDYNTAVGYIALTANTSGIQNSAIGAQALSGNTTGSYNTANGYFALRANTTGLFNTANGNRALTLNTTGASNTSSGYQSLANNTTGSLNTANGVVSLAANTTGENNTAEGSYSLNQNTTGSSNTANGYGALQFNTTGASSTAIGYQAGVGDGTTLDQQSVIDTFMTFFGFQASRDASVASTTALTNGTAIGKNARVGASNTIVLGGTGADAVNVGIGTTSPMSMLAVAGTITSNIINATSTTATSTFAGGFAVETNGFVYDYSSNNVGIGTTIPGYKLDVSGFINTDQYSGYKQAGNTILYASSTSFSTLVGNGAGAALLFDGIQNTAIGYQALNVATSSDSNTALGYRSLFANTTAGNNTGVGMNALLTNTTGGNNTAIGRSAMSSNTTGGSNTASGVDSLFSNISGGSNTVNGFRTFYSNTTGQGGTALGYQAGYGDGTTQDQRSVIDTFATFLGYQASRSETVASTSVLTNITAIGKNARVGASNTIVLGGTGADAVNVGIGTTTPYAKLSVVGEVVGAFFTATTTSNNTFPSLVSTNATTTSATSTNSFSTTASSTNLFTSNFSLGTLTGPLQAISGLVSASSTLSQFYGGTGFSTYTAGDLLYSGSANVLNKLSIGTGGYVLGVSNGLPAWVATTTLATISGTLTVAKGGTGQTSFGQGWLHSDGTTLTSSTSPTVNYLTATSTTATSTFAGGFAVETNGFVYDYSSNNVGIGTTIPGYKLDVSGFINTDQYSGYKQAGNTILYASSTNFSTLAGIGAGAALLSDGSQNTAIGYQALNVATSSDFNTAIGWRALFSNTTGFFNVAIGYSALNLNTIGYSNTAIGESALFSNSSGIQNTAIGDSALASNTTGTSSVAIGYQSGNANTVGYQNTFIGYSSGYTDGTVTTPNNLVNAAAIGYLAQATASNTLILGGTGAFAVNVGIGTTTPEQRLHVSQTATGVVARFTNGTGYCDINPTTTALVCTSDATLKKDVETIESALDSIVALRGVTFRWNSEEATSSPHIGFIAQEVEKVLPELVATDAFSGKKSVNYIGFVPVLIEAVKELANRVANLEAQISQSVSSGIANIKDFVVETLTAKKVITESIEMKDSVTGEIYCLKIANGEWEKVKGACASAPVEPEPQTVIPEIAPTEVVPTETPTAEATTTTETTLTAEVPTVTVTEDVVVEPVVTEAQ